jgi:hypothetical protein
MSWKLNELKWRPNLNGIGVYNCQRVYEHKTVLVLLVEQPKGLECAECGGNGEADAGQAGCPGVAAMYRFGNKPTVLVQTLDEFLEQNNLRQAAPEGEENGCQVEEEGRFEHPAIADVPPGTVLYVADANGKHRHGEYGYVVQGPENGLVASIRKVFESLKNFLHGRKLLASCGKCKPISTPNPNTQED